jgi:hypothetical protein
VFPLTGKDFPSSSEELATAIADALTEVLTLPNKEKVVTVSGGAFPHIRQLRINLDGASVSVTEPPPKPKPAGKREPGIEVDQLDVSGHPIRYEQSKLDLDLHAKGVKFDFARDKNKKPLMVLADAREGRVEAKMSKADIEAVVKSITGRLAKQQGISLQDLDLKLTSETDRSVAVEVRVKAKKMIMSGVIHIKGRLDLDDELNATVSGLSASGEGVVGAMVSGIVQSKLKPYEGKKFPLMAFSLGDTTLRDLNISAQGANLQVTASFGSNA